MAENTIDSLELEITSNSKEAADGIDRLSRSLLELEGSVSKGSSGLTSLQRALQGLSSGSGKIDLKIMDSAEIAGFEGNVKELTKYVQEYSDTAKNVKPLSPKVEDEKVIRTLEGIQEKYKDLGKDFKVFGTLDTLEKQLDKYSNALENAKLKKQELELSGNTGGNQYEKAIADVTKYENILGNINAQIKEMDVSNIKLLGDEDLQAFPSVKLQAELAKESLQDFGEESVRVGNEFKNAWNGAKLPDFSNTDLSSMSETELSNWFNNLPSIRKEVEETNLTVADFAKQLVKYQNIIAKGGMEGEGGFYNPYSEMVYDLRTLKELYPNAIGTAERYAKVLEEAGYSANFEEVEKGVEGASEKIDYATAQAERLSEAFKDIGTKYVFKGINMDDLLKELEETENKFDQLLAKEQEFKDSGNVNTPEFAKLEKELAETANKFEILKEKKKELENFNFKLSNLKIPSIDTKTIDELEKKLASAKERLESLKVKLENDITMGRVTVDVDDKGYQKAREQIALTEKEINQLETVIGHFNSIERLKESLASLGRVAIGAVVTPFKVIGKAISGTYNVIKTFGNGIKTVVSKISQLRKGLSGLLGVNKKNTSSFKAGLKTLLKYGFGVRSLYFLFRRFRGAIVDGYKNLVQYSSEVNHSISSMKSSLTMLKNAFAAAFSPIVNIVAPYLSTFIDMLSNAFNAVGRFFSALTGKSYAVQAKKAMEDYAGSIDSAAGSAKKLDKQLSVLPFDQLNQLSKDADSSSGGGSGSGDGVNAKDMFETVELEGDSWGKRIRDMFLAEDWQGLGEEVASGLNAGLQKVYDVISWDNVSKYVTPFIQGFTTSINSLVDNLNFTAIGSVVGAGVNTITNTLNSLIGEGGIDFQNIGFKISEGLRGAIEEIGWTELGNLFGNKFMISWNVLSGFVDGLAQENNAGISGWTELGNSIGEAFNGMLESVNLETVANSLVGALNGVFDSVTGFAQTFNWEQFGINISNGLNAAITTFNPQKMANSLNEIAHGILTSLIAFVENTDWELLGEKFKELIEGIDWNGISDEFFELLGSIFGGLGSFLVGALGEAVSGIKDYFLGYIITELGGLDEDASVWDIGHAILTGIWNGITNAIANAGKWIYDHVFTPFMEGFKNAFGIHSPSTVMEEQGGFIIDGLLNGLKSAIGGVLDWIGGIPGWFKEKLGNAKDWLVDKGKDALEGLKNGWETVKNSSLVQNAKSLGSTIITNVGNAKDWLVQKGKDAVSGLQSGWENIKSSSLIKTVGNLGKELITGIGDLSIDTRPKGEQAVTGMSEGVTQKTSVLNESFSRMSQAAIKSLDGMEPKFREIGAKLVLSLNTGIASGAPNITKQVSAMVSTISNSFKLLNTQMNNLGKSFMASLSDGILSNKEAVQRQVTSLMEFITNTLKLMPERMRQYGMQMMTALGNGISSNAPFVRNQVNNLVNNYIVNLITPVTQRLNVIGSNAIQSMSQGMNSSRNYISNSMQTILNLVFSYKGSLQSNGNLIGQWVNYGIYEGISSSMGYITGALNNVVNTVNSYSGSMYSAGQNLSRALQNGINSIQISGPSVSSSGSSSSKKSTRSILSENPQPLVSISSVPEAISTLSGFGKIGISPELQKYASYELGAGIAAQPISARIESSPYMRAISGSPANNFKSSGIDQTVLRDAVAQGVALAMMNNSGNQQPISVHATITLPDGRVLTDVVLDEFDRMEDVRPGTIGRRLGLVN